jgi:hypothetical protein
MILTLQRVLNQSAGGRLKKIQQMSRFLNSIAKAFHADCPPDVRATQRFPAKKEI